MGSLLGSRKNSGPRSCFTTSFTCRHDEKGVGSQYVVSNFGGSRASGPTSKYFIIFYVMTILFTGSSKINGAKLSDTCSVRVNWLCMGWLLSLSAKFNYSWFADTGLSKMDRKRAAALLSLNARSCFADLQLLFCYAEGTGTGDNDHRAAASLLLPCDPFFTSQ